jgi:hypothetical protein
LYGFTHKCQEKREKIENSTRLNETINEASLALMMSLKINFYLEQEEDGEGFCVLPISGISSMAMIWMKNDAGDNKPH